MLVARVLQGARRDDQHVQAGAPGDGAAAAAAAVVRTKADGPLIALRIRVTAAEYALILQRAERDGFSPLRWIVALLRGQLLQQPQLGQPEMDALEQANLRLLQVGRNINQIARALNAAPHEFRAAPELAQLKLLSEAIDGQARAVSALLDANHRRWKPT